MVGFYSTGHDLLKAIVWHLMENLYTDDASKGNNKIQEVQNNSRPLILNCNMKIRFLTELTEASHAIGALFG